AIKSMVDTVATITPKIPTVDVPFADQLPKPQDVVASGYDFAQKLLTSQRKFADEVVKAAAPLLPGNGDSKQDRARPSKARQDEGGKTMASTPTQDLQNEVLNTVRKSQETVIDALKTWVETVQSITPKIPAVDMPFADKLPKPEEVVASAYDFAEQLLASQRKFAEEVLKATSSLTPGTQDSTK